MYYFKILPTVGLILFNTIINIVPERFLQLDNIYKINIQYNLNNLYTVFNDIYFILLGITVFYGILAITNKLFDNYYKKFRKDNPNLVETKTNYFLWGQLLITLVKLHEFSTAILIFISLTQLKFMNKKINFINYLLLITYGLTTSIIDWIRDYETHKQNNKKCMIVRNKQLIYVKSSSIRVGDILYLRRNNSVRVKEALVIDQDVVAFNLGQTGERTIEEFKVGSKVLEGLIIKNQELVKLRVCKTYSSNQLIEDNINTVKNLNSIMTYIGISTILLFSTFVILNKHKTNLLEFGDLLLDVLGCFIGLNYLIPSFKVAQSLNLWDSVYKYITLTFSDFKVCNHGPVDINFTPNNTVILSDKTGTLTNNTLTLEKLYIDENHIDLILGHINSYLDDDLKHTSHSPETNIIANHICKKYKIKQKSNYHWTNKEQIIEYSLNGNLQKILRICKITYKDTNFGSHSLLSKNNKYYHVFMGSKYLLSRRLNYVEKENSVKRGLLIGCIELEENNMDMALEKFRNNLIENYEVIGEFHFNNFYRESKFGTTKSGIEKIKKDGYPFIVITGDSLLTAKDIGLELGVISGTLAPGDNNSNMTVLDGSEFMKKLDNEKEEIIKRLLEIGGGVFGNTRAIYKEKIVEYFQKYRKVIFLGDQENDYLALRKADLAIVQEKGNSKCKNIANLIGNIPTEIVYNYLSKYRNIGIEGKWWFYLKMNIFNYFTAGVWLIGLIDKKFTKTSIIFNDPWEPRDSLFMSIFVTIYLLFRSFSKKPIIKNKNYKCIFTSLCTLCLSLLLSTMISNMLYSISLEEYFNILSIPLITLFMII